MEDKIYTTDELIDMDVYTSDFEFMDKACEVLGTLNRYINKYINISST